MPDLKLDDIIVQARELDWQETSRGAPLLECLVAAGILLEIAVATAVAVWLW